MRVVVEVLDEAQAQGGRAPSRAAARSAPRRRRRRGRPREGDGRQLGGGELAAARAVGVDRGGGGDAVQPRAQVLGVAQPRIGAQRAQERVLEDVLGVLVAGQRRACASSSSPCASTRLQNGGSARCGHTPCNAARPPRCEAVSAGGRRGRRAAAGAVACALLAAFARAFWRRRPTNASTPSTIATSRKPQKTRAPGRCRRTAARRA